MPPQLQCHQCGYVWEYSGSLDQATCPNCSSKVPVDRARLGASLEALADEYDLTVDQVQELLKRVEDQLSDEREAMAIWDSHLRSATRRWQEGARDSQADYRRSLADFLDVPEREITDRLSHEWQEDVTRLSPEEFKRTITTEGADWLIGLYEDVTGQRAPERVRDIARRIDETIIADAGDDVSGDRLAERIRDEIRGRG